MGNSVGEIVGPIAATRDGALVSASVGSMDGISVGSKLGIVVGSVEGLSDGGSPASGQTNEGGTPRSVCVFPTTKARNENREM